MSYLHWTSDAFSAYPELYNPKPNTAFFKHMKVWFAYIVTITHCKIKNVMDFVPVELPVKHDTQCPADIPDNHLVNRKNRNYSISTIHHKQLDKHWVSCLVAVLPQQNL